jgi:hypothetical protein
LSLTLIPVVVTAVVCGGSDDTWRCAVEYGGNLFLCFSDSVSVLLYFVTATVWLFLFGFFDLWFLFI